MFENPRGVTGVMGVTLVDVIKSCLGMRNIYDSLLMLSHSEFL